MLKHLQKFFNGDKTLSQEEVPMTDQEKAALAAAELKTAELSAALEVITASLSEKDAALASLTTKYEAATAALAQSADAQATLVANAKAKVLASRTASLSAIMGDVKGPQVAVSLESLDDSTFATVLNSYANSFEAESKSEMFVEKGVAAEAKPVVEEDAVQRLAAKLAAQFPTK